jgi:hypothetical protein
MVTTMHTAETMNFGGLGAITLFLLVYNEVANAGYLRETRLITEQLYHMSGARNILHGAAS